VVRDLTKKDRDQELWVERGVPADHQDIFIRKMLAKERAEADVLADRINALIGAH
jgi:hypothetical protein